MPSTLEAETSKTFLLVLELLAQISLCLEILSGAKFLLQIEHWERPAFGANFGFSLDNNDFLIDWPPRENFGSFLGDCARPFWGRNVFCPLLLLLLFLLFLLLLKLSSLEGALENFESFLGCGWGVVFAAEWRLSKFWEDRDGCSQAKTPSKILVVVNFTFLLLIAVTLCALRICFFLLPSPPFSLLCSCPAAPLPRLISTLPLVQSDFAPSLRPRILFASLEWELSLWHLSRRQMNTWTLKSKIYFRRLFVGQIAVDIFILTNICWQIYLMKYLLTGANKFARSRPCRPRCPVRPTLLLKKVKVKIRKMKESRVIIRHTLMLKTTWITVKSGFYFGISDTVIWTYKNWNQDIVIFR